MLKRVKNISELNIIESDSLSSLYKSAQHFDDIQCICNKKKVPVVCLFSIVEDGKGEADHVEGIAKCTIRHYVGRAIFNATYWR